jgi:hypothetical protein
MPVETRSIKRRREEKENHTDITSDKRRRVEIANPTTPLFAAPTIKFRLSEDPSDGKMSTKQRRNGPETIPVSLFERPKFNFHARGKRVAFSVTTDGDDKSKTIKTDANPGSKRRRRGMSANNKSRVQEWNNEYFRGREKKKNEKKRRRGEDNGEKIQVIYIH